jgi:1-acyl-sn-glycerol-3-phosphate acyltransferase
LGPIRALHARREGTPLWRSAVYEGTRLIAAALLIVLYRLRWRGGANFPENGPFLIIANHQSLLDPPMLSAMCTRRHIEFIARGGLFKNKVFGWGIASLNAIPIREDGGGDLGAMKEALRRLDQGRAVLIFPEGSRSFDGAMTEFKRGVAVLVKRANCPVVPVGIDGLHEAWPRGRKYPRLVGGRIAGVVGTPISHEELMKDGVDAAMRRLEREVESLRMRARGLLRRSSRGAYPPSGPGDSSPFAGDPGGDASRIGVVTLSALGSGA